MPEPDLICSLQTINEYDFRTARQAWGSSKHPMRCSCWRSPMTISKTRRCCYIRVAGHDMLESLRLQTTTSTAETRLLGVRCGTVHRQVVPVPVVSGRVSSPPYASQRTRSRVDDGSMEQKSFPERHTRWAVLVVVPSIVRSGQARSIRACLSLQHVRGWLGCVFAKTHG